MNEQARKLCLLGYVDAELASFFDIAESTLNDWKNRYPAFSESIKAGKEAADAEVADCLYRRATGETVVFEKAVKKEDGGYEAMRLKQFIPGDVQAQRLWLLNRRKQSWRDKQDIDLAATINIVVNKPQNEIQEVILVDPDEAGR